MDADFGEIPFGEEGVGVPRQFMRILRGHEHEFEDFVVRLQDERLVKYDAREGGHHENVCFYGRVTDIEEAKVVRAQLYARFFFEFSCYTREPAFTALQIPTGKRDLTAGGLDPSTNAEESLPRDRDEYDHGR